METCVDSTTAEASDLRLAVYLYFFSFFLFFFSSLSCVSFLSKRFEPQNPKDILVRNTHSSLETHHHKQTIYIKMATSSTFIAQPNFLVKKNVFTVSQSCRASFFCVCSVSLVFKIAGRISRETRRRF